MPLDGMAFRTEQSDKNFGNAPTFCWQFTNRLSADCTLETLVLYAYSQHI